MRRRVRTAIILLCIGAVLSVVNVGWTGSRGQNPLTAARFSFQIDGVEIGRFKGVAGLDFEVEVADYVDDPNSTFRKLPGKQLPPTITLKRGKSRNLAFWRWYEDVVNKGIAASLKDAAIVLYTDEQKEVSRYYIFDAWPSKIEIGALQAGASEVLMETVQIVCESIQRVEP